MNLNSPFVRKVMYITAIMLLLFPLFLLGQPATSTGRGGKLAQLRAEHSLSQAQLGDIDPLSISMQLATFGLRGVAVNILWEKATYYHKTEDFDNLSATLNQITKLQPHFLKVWEYQAHNLSYNISSEFDDYRQRYDWVKRGINFLVEGTRYNRQQPKLLQNVGDFIGQKIGTPDERIQFRQLFLEDRDFHQTLDEEDGIDAFTRRALGPTGKPDNWLIAWQWYQRAEDAVDPLGRRHLGKEPLYFYMLKPKSLISFAMAIEEEGFLDEKGREAFRRASEGWTEMGTRDIATPSGFSVRMNDLELHRRAAADLRQQIISLSGDLYERIKADKESSLTEIEREAMALPASLRGDQENSLVRDAENKLQILNEDIVALLPPELRPRGASLARAAEDRFDRVTAVEYCRELTNFEYFMMRCEVEQLKIATDARLAVRLADEFFVNTEVEKARDQYELAWDKWAEIFRKFPRLLDDPEAEILRQSVGNYEQLLAQFDETIPDDFKLRQLIEKYEMGNRLPDGFNPTGMPQGAGN